VGHTDAVRLHGMALAIVIVADVVVIEVADPILGRHGVVVWMSLRSRVCVDQGIQKIELQVLAGQGGCHVHLEYHGARGGLTL